MPRTQNCWYVYAKYFSCHDIVLTITYFPLFMRYIIHLKASLKIFQHFSSIRIESKNLAHCVFDSWCCFYEKKTESDL